SRLTALESILHEFLSEATPMLLRQLDSTTTRADALRALISLRADTGTKLLPLITRADFKPLDQGIELLTWSSDPSVGPWLRKYAQEHVAISRRGQWRKRMRPPARPSISEAIPYRQILRAMRGHPSIETENFLMQAALDWDPTYRQAACSSFGWWE